MMRRWCVCVCVCMCVYVCLRVCVRANVCESMREREVEYMVMMRSGSVCVCLRVCLCLCLFAKHCNRGCSVDECVDQCATRYFATHYTATHCNTLQHTTLQHTATTIAVACKHLNCNTLINTLQHTATHCNTLQHTATHCNTLHHTATPGSDGANNASVPGVGPRPFRPLGAQRPQELGGK